MHGRYCIFLFFYLSTHSFLPEGMNPSEREDIRNGNLAFVKIQMIFRILTVKKGVLNGEVF